jgi:hypothetical protein
VRWIQDIFKLEVWSEEWTESAESRGVVLSQQRVPKGFSRQPRFTSPTLSASGADQIIALSAAVLNRNLDSFEHSTTNHGLSHNDFHTATPTYTGTSPTTNIVNTNPAPLPPPPAPPTTTISPLLLQPTLNPTPTNNTVLNLDFSNPQIPPKPLSGVRSASTHLVNAEIQRMEPGVLLHHHLHPDRVPGHSNDRAEE